MIAFLRPAPAAAPLEPSRVDPEYRRQRRRVFLGIFLGYAAYYLVRNNLALAIPDILREYPQYSKAQLGTALTGLSVAYGLSKFLMGSVSDRSNPKYFLSLGLLLSCAIMLTSGLVKAVYSSLALVIALQTLNGWVQGMGWPPCGKTMVHWFATKERGRVVAFWNVSHNVGGALVANFALLGVVLFGDWGAKFYFNAMIAALIAIVIFFMMRDTPQSCGLPPVEVYKNDYRAGYSADHERTFTFREIFFEHVFTNKFLWAIAVANAFAYFVRYGVVNWIPTYLETAKGFSFRGVEPGLVAVRIRGHPGDDRLRLDVRPGLQEPPRARHHAVHGTDAGGGGRLLAQPAWPVMDRLRRADRDRLPDLWPDHDHRAACAGSRAEESRGHRGRVHRLFRIRLRLGARGHRRRLDRRPLGLERGLHHDDRLLRADHRLQRPDPRRPCREPRAALRCLSRSDRAIARSSDRHCTRSPQAGIRRAASGDRPGWSGSETAGKFLQAH
jgi:glycerol-3-phosphate transporter